MSSSSVSACRLAGSGSRSSSRAAAGSAAASRAGARTPPCCALDRDAAGSARARAASPPARPATPGRAARRSPSPARSRRSSRRGSRAPAAAARPSSRRARRRQRIRAWRGGPRPAGWHRDSRATRRPESRAGWRCTRVRPWRTVCSSASAEAATTLTSQASTASACWASIRTWFSAALSLARRRRTAKHRAALLREAHEVEHALPSGLRGVPPSRSPRRR